MIQGLQDFVAGFDPVFQWVAVGIVSMIPFVESYFGALIGVVVGIPPFVAIAAAVIGNWISMFVVVMFGEKLFGAFKKKDAAPSPRKEKFLKYFNRFGVAGVSLLGQTVLPSQITSFGMIGLGAKRSAIIFWQTISIILWGTIFGLFGQGIVGFFG